MRTAAIIPVKTFGRAKTRLGLPPARTEALCRFMLGEVLRTVSISPRIDETVMVTGEEGAARIGEGFGVTHIAEREERGVNAAVALADAYLLEHGFDASVVFPQDIPYIRTQDIDFVLGHAAPPNFAVIVPSRKFDGTNALVRMPADLMGTHYDAGGGEAGGGGGSDGGGNNSYRMHMAAARERTPNAALVFAKRIMWDVDDADDLRFLLRHGGEDPRIAGGIADAAGIR